MIGWIIIAKNDRILGMKAVSRNKLRDTDHVIDTSPKFVPCTEVVDSNQEGLQSASNPKVAGKWRDTFRRPLHWEY